MDSGIIDLPLRGSGVDSVLRRNVVCFPIDSTSLRFVQLPSKVEDEHQTRKWDVALKLESRSIFKFHGGHMDFDPATNVFILLDNERVMNEVNHR